MSKFWKAGAFLQALWCWVRRHKVLWHENIDPPICTRGDVVCETCNVCWWCRAHG